jgi:hypothetical protein
MMQILDFNIHPYRRPTSIGMYDFDEWITDRKLVLEPSRILPNAVFTEPVISTLPYHSLSRTDTVRYSGFMIDEERLVGLKVGFEFCLHLS